jgi:hypothetical protein
MSWIRTRNIFTSIFMSHVSLTVDGKEDGSHEAQ